MGVEILYVTPFWNKIVALDVRSLFEARAEARAVVSSYPGEFWTV